jgi:hypothetical protein
MRTNIKTVEGTPLNVLWLDQDQPVAVLIQQARKALIERHPAARNGQRHLFHLALNEAEALAWQTPFPHLVFPALAEEKIRELHLWQDRQRFVRRQSGEMAFAA